ncbi:MAG: hypothetical protein IPH86_17910 [bacterium]|nr:hypothetical protein [bacterium]
MILQFMVHLRLAATAFACALFALAGQAAAQAELPAHLHSALPKGGVVAHSEPCGSDCFLVFACAAGDTTGGTVLRLAGRAGETPRSVAEGAWVRSDLAGAGGLVRGYGELTPDQVRAAIEAVRTNLRPRENVRDVRVPAPKADRGDTVVTVELARDGAGPGQSRLLRVHLAADGAFVESRGIATH